MDLSGGSSSRFCNLCPGGEKHVKIFTFFPGGRFEMPAGLPGRHPGGGFRVSAKFSGG